MYKKNGKKIFSKGDVIYYIDKCISSSKDLIDEYMSNPEYVIDDIKFKVILERRELINNLEECKSILLK